MKLTSKDFRVRPGKKVHLNKWPTLVSPFCKSKEQFQELLGEHVRTSVPLCGKIAITPWGLRIVEVAAMIGDPEIAWTDGFALRPIQSVRVSRLQEAQHRSVDVRLSDLKDNTDCVAPAGK